jgi:hypothetical protein
MAAKQPRDEAGLIIDANNAAYEVAEAADLVAQAAPSPGAARDAARAERAAQYQAGAAREAAWAERGAQNHGSETRAAAASPRAGTQGIRRCAGCRRGRLQATAAGPPRAANLSSATGEFVLT